MTQLNSNKTQTIDQLTALGRNELYPWVPIKINNNQIYAFHLPNNTLHKLITHGKGDDRERWENGNLKYYFGQCWQDGLNKLSQLAEEGKEGKDGKIIWNEIFLIPNYIPLNPNKANGIGADFISHAPALFAEIDDLSIPEQWEKIERLKAQLGLEPGLIVFSGNRSLHINFPFDRPLTDLEEWKRLQRKLICVLNSDPAIANPNREMRLAGVARKSKGGFQSLELQNDRVYSPQEIERILDSSGKFPHGLDDERFRRWRREGDAVLGMTPEELNPPRPKRDSREFEVDRFGDAAPLEIFLTKHDQEIIASGVGSERNWYGMKLVKNLVGTEERLSQLGIPFTGNAYDLFIDYCHACPSGGGWNHREWEQIWRYHSRRNPDPSIPDDGLQKRAYFYQWERNGGGRSSYYHEQRLEAERARLEQLYGKEVTREEWLTNKASEWWEWLVNKAGDFQDLFRVSRGKAPKVKGEKPRILQYGIDPLPTPGRVNLSYFKSLDIVLRSNNEQLQETWIRRFQEEIEEECKEIGARDGRDGIGNYFSEGIESTRPDRKRHEENKSKNEREGEEIRAGRSFDFVETRGGRANNRESIGYRTTLQKLLNLCDNKDIKGIKQTFDRLHDTNPKGFGSNESPEAIEFIKRLDHGFWDSIKNHIRSLTRELRDELNLLPEIQFKQGQRLKLYQDLIALGWGYLLDRSHTGTGKSHEYNLLTKDKDEDGKTQGKIWYLHGDHRNPTVEPAEKKADLPSRHNGLTQDHTRHTPSGEPFQRRWKWDEEKPHPDIPSNCPETDRFNNLSTKGYNIHAKQTEEGEKKQNPICAQCPILHDCIESGYKAQRKTVMEQSEVRAHPDSLPSPEDYNYGDDSLAWEEFSQLFNPTEERSLTKKDLDQQWEWLERENSEVYDRLRPIKHKLTDLLRAKWKGEGSLPRFGVNTFPDAPPEANLRELLGVVDYPELEADLLVLKEINDRAVAMSDVEAQEADHVYAGNFKNDKERNEWKEAQKAANAHFRKEARNKNRDLHADLPTLGLYELILILFDGSEAVTNHREVNDVFGCAVVNHGELTLTLNNSRHRSIAQSAKTNIFLDATARPEDVAVALGIDETELVTIYQKPPEFDNLTIHGIHIQGMASREHSDDCNRRKQALVEQILSDLPKGEDCAVISFKGDDIEHHGEWFIDSRSTNKFKGVNNLIAFGTPYQNLGAVKANYFTLHRTLEGFDDYYQHLKEAEIIQAIGRQRSHLYPEQYFNLYLIGTNLDLTFLEEMGIRVEASHGLEWTPEAGHHSQNLKVSLIKKALELGDQFWKLTQTEVAKQLEISQARVSQILKAVGGKKRLQKLLMSLYGEYIGGFIKSKAIYTIKELQTWLNLTPDDLNKMGLDEDAGKSVVAQGVDGILTALEQYFKHGGLTPEEFEQQNDISLFLACSIVLGASPPE